MGRNAGAIQAIKDRMGIADVVRRYVELRPAGSRLVGRCPFHQETQGSFHVVPDQGFFYCFGCHATGDVITFYSRINGLEFPEALRQLAQEAGVTLDNRYDSPEDRERGEKRKAYLDMHTLAGELFRRGLRMAEGEKARSYIARRGLTPEIVERFGLGYSLDDWHWLDNFLRGKGHTSEAGAQAGLLVRNEKGNIYDRFRDRLIFPIRDVAGRIIAFGGRILGDGEPKYLNSSDSPIYKKGDNLYGLYEARPAITTAKRALLSEGYMDVISMHQFGFANACGVLGTALTPSQVKRLAGFCSGVDLVFDGDRAGRQAALKSAEMVLTQGLECKVVSMPDGEDVDSLLQKQGADAFRRCLAEAADGLDYCMGVVRKQSPREVVAWAVKFLRDLADSAWRAYFIPRLAAGLNLSEADLRRSLSGEGGGPPEVRAVFTRGAQGNGQTIAGRDREVLGIVFRNQASLETLVEHGLLEALSGETARELVERLRVNADKDPREYLQEEEFRLRSEALLRGGEAEWDSERELADFYNALEMMRLDRLLREAKANQDFAEMVRLQKMRQERLKEAR